MKSIFKFLLAFVIIFVLAVASIWTISSAADFQLFASLGGDKTQVTPSDTVQYTVTVRNDGVQNLDNVRVNQNFIPEITYINGSTTAEKNNQTINVPDNWTGAGGFNFGTLSPGQIGYIKFSGTVAANATAGSTLKNAVAIRSDQTEWVGQAHSVTVISANQTAILRGGDFLKVRNNTLQTPWADSLNIDPFQVAEFILKIGNDGQNPARNVHISANLPVNNLVTQNPTVTLTADNAASVTDSVTVTSANPFHLSYKLGHATLIGNTGLYNCPNGCVIPDSFYESPLNLGTINPGEVAVIQVGFKADVIPAATPTPTPTPTNTPVPTPTPTTTPTSQPNSPTSNCVSLTGSPLNGVTPLTVTFTGTGYDSAGSIQQYQFNFGDTSNGQNQIVFTNSNQATHVYYNQGTFIATLMVKDSRGNWVSGNSCQVNINTNNQPVVLGTTAPAILPKTGNDDAIYLILASIPVTLAGIYLYRKFRLI